MVSLDINKDPDRQLIVLFNRNNITAKILRTKGSTYLLDFENHDDYIRAKKCQILLDNMDVKNVPVV